MSAHLKFITFIFFYHLAFCPNQLFLLSTLFQFGVLSRSTFCLFDIFYHSTFCHLAFCPIQRFVLRRFLPSTFFTSTFCRCTLLPGLAGADLIFQWVVCRLAAYSYLLSVTRLAGRKIHIEQDIQRRTGPALFVFSVSPGIKPGDIVFPSHK